MKINVAIPLYNVQESIAKTIESIQEQTVSDFTCVLVDDGSTDQTVSIIDSLVKDDLRFKLIKQSINRSNALSNIVDAFAYIHVDMDSICVIIDGDDWLIDQFVFKKLLDCYRTKMTNLTYGQYITYPQNIVSKSQPLPEWVIQQSLYRCVYPFFLTPIRSFRGKLWHQLDKDNLRSKNGEFFSSAYDASLMFSLAEISDGFISFIDEPLYVYNRTTAYHNDHIRPKLQQQYMAEIRSRPTSCDQCISESDRWSKINNDQLSELLDLEKRVMLSFDEVGKSFFKEPFNQEKHSQILQHLRN